MTADLKRLLFRPLAVVICLLVCSVDAANRTPNIVLIMADDIGVEGIGCYGGLSYKTPNIDRLADEGLRFEHAYSQPLCANTRLQLMTGLHNNRNWSCFGILDTEAKTFGHFLKEAGYKTCIAGKWQLQSYDPPDYPGAEKRRGLGMHPKDSGFERYSLFHSLHTEDKGSRYADPTWLEDGELKTAPGKYGPDMWVDYINSFVEKEKDHPFFVYYAMALPHWPMTPTPDSRGWKDRANRDVADADKNFKGMVEYMDKCIGKVVGKLDDLGLRDDTLILFYSDNGTHLAVTSQTKDGPVAGGKALPTNAGTHVPMIASWPGKVRAGVSDALVDSVDFLPTLMESAGKPLSEGAMLDGVSFYPQLMGKEPANPREWIYSFYDPRPGWDKDRFRLSVSARDRRWKLYDNGRLFDIDEDILEAKPILPHQDTEESATVRKRLSAVIKEQSAKGVVTRLDMEHSVDGKSVFVADNYAAAEYDGRQPRRGDWKIENGIASVTQDDGLYKKHKNHGPIMIYQAAHTDAHAVVDFRPTGCRTVVFTMDAVEGGHAFRVRLRTQPVGVAASDRKSPPSSILTYGPRPKGGKAEMITLSDDVPKLVDGQWNRIEVRVQGEHASVIVGGKTIEVKHPRIAQKKKIAKLGFAFGELDIREFKLSAIKE